MSAGGSLNPSANPYPSGGPIDNQQRLQTSPNPSLPTADYSMGYARNFQPPSFFNPFSGYYGANTGMGGFQSQFGGFQPQFGGGFGGGFGQPSQNDGGFGSPYGGFGGGFGQPQQFGGGFGQPQQGSFGNAGNAYAHRFQRPSLGMFPPTSPNPKQPPPGMELNPDYIDRFAGGRIGSLELLPTDNKFRPIQQPQPQTVDDLQYRDAQFRPGGGDIVYAGGSPGFYEAQLQAKQRQGGQGYGNPFGGGFGGGYGNQFGGDTQDIPKPVRPAGSFLGRPNDPAGGSFVGGYDPAGGYLGGFGGGYSSPYMSPSMMGGLASLFGGMQGGGFQGMFNSPSQAQAQIQAYQQNQQRNFN